MADNKNQAQLLEDYGQNVLSGAGGGGEYFPVAIYWDEDTSLYKSDVTAQELQDAYDSGKLFLIVFDSGAVYDIGAPVFTEGGDFDGISKYIVRGSDSTMTMAYITFYNVSDPDNYGYSITEYNYTMTPET